MIKSKEELLDLFSSWINSPKSLYVSTKLEELNVVPVWDDVDTKLCTVDTLILESGMVVQLLEEEDLYIIFIGKI